MYVGCRLSTEQEYKLFIPQLRDLAEGGRACSTIALESLQSRMSAYHSARLCVGNCFPPLYYHCPGIAGGPPTGKH